MVNGNKVKTKYRSYFQAFPLPAAILTILTLIFITPVQAQQPEKLKTIATKDSFDLKNASKDSLSSPIRYKASDSSVLYVPEKKMILYGKTSGVLYEDYDLKAPKIEYDQQTSLVRAVLVKDSAGRVLAFPEFVQGDFKSKMDTILFNMRTGKGITKGTYTQQGEMFVYGETIKRVSPEIFYAGDARFTTCNLDTPHFAFKAQKIKFVNKQWAYSGPVHPEFEEVPLPIVLPFGIFPLKQGRRSGLLAPSFEASSQFGISMRDIGYYKVIGDNFDAVIYGTLYSYGGYEFRIQPQYYKRYKYRGGMIFGFNNFKPLDMPSNKTFRIDWNHSADMKARPGVTFNARVSVASTRFNEQVPNQPYTNFDNQLSSSISYTKNWQDKPFSLSVTANHSQNNLNRYMQIDFPGLNFNMQTIYPLRRKDVVSDLRWYENLGIGLQTQAIAQTFLYDTAGNISRQIIDNYKYGISHSVPITLSLPSFGPLQVTPSVSYRELWFQQKIQKQWNSNLRRVDTASIEKGFFTAREMSFGLGLSTRIFGIFGFGKNSRVEKIRHQITPTISISYKPDLSRNFNYDLQIDSLGSLRKASLYEGNLLGSPSSGRFGGISFNLDNTLAMKVRSKTDTAASASKKISLLDAFSINTSYNFLLDSFKLSDINMMAGTNLFEKVNITASALFSPYDVNSNGRRIDQLIWKRKLLSFGTLTSGSVSLSTSFRGGDKKKGTTSSQAMTDRLSALNGLKLDDYQREAAYIDNNPGMFVDFNIPWEISLSYSLRYSNQTYGQEYAGPPLDKFSQDVNFQNSVNISPKWKFGTSGSYNITNGSLGYMSMFLSREMHCWQMSVNVSPVGKYRFFSINIQPKSPILRDLKINRTRSYYDGF